jgi:cell shape-determining protein MreC
MSLRFNNVFAICMMAALAGAILIPPSVTDRAKGKADVLLYPVVKPVRSIAASIQRRFGHKPLPPGETRLRTDSELAAENGVLKQQLTYLIKQLEDLRLVEEERKRLGPLLDYFKPVEVIAGDATPGRDSLSLMPTSGVDTAPDAPVM